jgi:hypothetical protein
LLNEADTRAKLIDPAIQAKEIEDAVYDLKAVNPHRKPGVDDRTPEELMDIIAAKGQEIADALAGCAQNNRKKGWEHGLSDEEISERLLTLNLERAGAASGK